MGTMSNIFTFVFILSVVSCGEQSRYSLSEYGDSLSFLQTSNTTSELEKDGVRIFISGETHGDPTSAGIEAKMEALARNNQHFAYGAEGVDYKSEYEGYLRATYKHNQNYFGLEDIDVYLIENLLATFENAASAHSFTILTKSLNDPDQLYKKTKKIFRDGWIDAQTELKIRLWQSKWGRRLVEETNLPKSAAPFANSIKDDYLKYFKIPTFERALVTDPDFTKTVRTQDFLTDELAEGSSQFYRELMLQVAKDQALATEVAGLLKNMAKNHEMDLGHLRIDYRNTTFVNNTLDYIKSNKPQVVMLNVGHSHRHGLVYLFSKKFGWEIIRNDLSRSKKIFQDRVMDREKDLKKATTSNVLRIESLQSEIVYAKAQIKIIEELPKK